jgi:hypothetical protein
MPMRIRILATLAVVSALVAGCEQPRQAATPPQQTAASGPTYTFRLAPARNLVGCSRLDAALSREATVTVVGNEAHFRSAGGINDTGRQVRPGVYATDYSLANVRLDVVADLSQPTKTLTVTEKNAGCRWSGETR